MSSQQVPMSSAHLPAQDTSVMTCSPEEYQSHAHYLPTSSTQDITQATQYPSVSVSVTSSCSMGPLKIEPSEGASNIIPDPLEVMSWTPNYNAVSDDFPGSLGFTASVEGPPTQNYVVNDPQKLFLRVFPKYTDANHVNQPVLPCPSHRDDKMPAYVLTTDEVGAHAPVRQMCWEQTRATLCFALQFQPYHHQKQSARLKFLCNSSCSGGMDRRSLQLVFVLEDEGGNEKGRKSINVRICACPSRDVTKEEEKMAGSWLLDGQPSSMLSPPYSYIRSPSEHTPLAVPTPVATSPPISANNEGFFSYPSGEVKSCAGLTPVVPLPPGDHLHLQIMALLLNFRQKCLEEVPQTRALDPRANGQNVNEPPLALEPGAVLPPDGSEDWFRSHSPSYLLPNAPTTVRHASLLDMEHWMAQLPLPLHYVPLSYLAIPGTHDSFTYSLDRTGPIAPVMLQTMLDPYLAPPPERYEDLTLAALRGENTRVIVIYRNSLGVKLYPKLWPSLLAPNPWPNTDDDKKLLRCLDQYLQRRRPDLLFIAQGILTPSFWYILARPLGTIRGTVAHQANKALRKWLPQQRSGQGGVNIVIADFVNERLRTFTDELRPVDEETCPYDTERKAISRSEQDISRRKSHPRLSLAGSLHSVSSQASQDKSRRVSASPCEKAKTEGKEMKESQVDDSDRIIFNFDDSMTEKTEPPGTPKVSWKKKALVWYFLICGNVQRVATQTTNVPLGKANPSLLFLNEMTNALQFLLAHDGVHPHPMGPLPPGVSRLPPGVTFPNANSPPVANSLSGTGPDCFHYYICLRPYEVGLTYVDFDHQILLLECLKRIASTRDDDSETKFPNYPKFTGKNEKQTEVTANSSP
ncbi:unnamed protein product [Cyprideis torosa]|uniref:p53 DNA-binding domain-containing protein n=1 Tax=Cyprideis torosa TaxID=163714 RepID=A0A7R8WE64_9CRUS|nr:unnamed protein product [Cyprideis torosa]CAG0894000.1 unnamed protein product [Cyprideis torosa]